MCGITGIVNLTRFEPILEAHLRQMLAMIRHRGPDQFGIYLDDQVGLANARLSIIDLEGGQQPIANEDETLWIVFNGEIFNYVELRLRLEARGHHFATHTDTEVILHLYEEHGPACLAQLNGQFAFAIWDTQAQALFLARDRLGIRPLFYTLAKGALIFGSEIKAILADPRVRAEIDPVALSQVFTYWSALAPRTIFRDILELPPGHYLLACRGAVTIARYWQLSFPEAGGECQTPPGKRVVGDYLDEFRSLLVDATQIRLRADVPVGAYLSGGLDSSTIAAIVRGYTRNHLDTFSIAFDDPGFDESLYQQKMADHLGTRHHVVRATYADIGRVFPEVIWHTETPILRTAPAPMFLLSRLVRQNNFKVVLTGEGADEFLAGYDIFKEAKVRRFWARRPESRLRPLLLTQLYPDIADLAGSGRACLNSFFGQGLTDLEADDYSHAIRWRNTRRTQRFFADEVQQAVARAGDLEVPAISYPPDFHRWGHLQQAQYLEITTFLSPYLLSSQGDRVGMAHAVEGRFPFLDYRLIEFCNQLPAHLKLRGLDEKYLLKQAALAWLPAAIWRRPKRPYRAPIHRSFFHAATPGYVRGLLSPGTVAAFGLFKPAAVSQLVRKIEEGKRLSETDDMALAGIVSSQLVYMQFVSDFQMPPPLAARHDVKVCRPRQVVCLQGAYA
jgi:asparagine synthase (glutamine-hydrolysing)